MRRLRRRLTSPIVTIMGREYHKEKCGSLGADRIEINCKVLMHTQSLLTFASMARGTSDLRPGNAPNYISRVMGGCVPANSQAAKVRTKNGGKVKSEQNGENQKKHSAPGSELAMNLHLPTTPEVLSCDRARLRICIGHPIQLGLDTRQLRSVSI